MTLPNTIIAGPPKAGTTSVFRYLAAHPDVCPSSIKEIHFFEHYLNNINNKTLDIYKNHFKSCNSSTKIRLEASPRYLQGGNPVANAIHKQIPDAKLIFILREPIERFLSRYISLVTKTDRIPEHYLDLDNLIDKALTHPKAQPTPDKPELDDEIIEYLWQGCYADFINGYIEIHGAENIALLFFDDLKHRPLKFMQSFCQFIGIDESYYSDFQFRIENKTRVVKFRGLHKIAEKMNRKFEFIQNKFPRLRQLIKGVYYSLLNPESMNNNIVDTQYAKKELEKYYKPHNDRLKKLLSTHYPDIEMPEWLDT